MTLSPPVLDCHEAVAGHHSSLLVTKSNQSSDENERQTAMTLSPPVLDCHEAVAEHHSSLLVTKSN